MTRMRATFVIEYDPFLYEAEGLTPEQIAQRDAEEFRLGELEVEDVEGYSCLSIEVAPAPNGHVRPKRDT